MGALPGGAAGLGCTAFSGMFTHVASRPAFQGSDRRPAGSACAQVCETPPGHRGATHIPVCTSALSPGGSVCGHRTGTADNTSWLLELSPLSSGTFHELSGVTL